MGKLHFLSGDLQNEVTKNYIKENQIGKEILKFEKTLIKAEKQIVLIQNQLRKKLTSEENKIFDAHLLILKDPVVTSLVKENMQTNLTDAAYSYFIIIQNIINKLGSTKNKYFQSRTQDLEDVSSRVLDILNKRKKKEHYASPTILIIKDTFSSLLSRLQNQFVKGIITQSEIKNSHFSIITRSLQLPTISGVSVQKLAMYEGCYSILNATEGTLIINPSNQDIKKYQRQNKKNQLELKLKQTENIQKESKNQDLIPIQIDSNMEFYQEIDKIIQKGINSIGLYRSEYLLMSQGRVLTEQEQYKVYSSVSNKLTNGHFIIRTFDSDYDKNVPGFPNLMHEINSSMGFRSTRFTLKQSTILKDQLRAILKASATRKNIKILFPFISTAQDFIELKEITQSIIQECIKQNIPVDENIPLGCMIEIPSAAISIEDFVEHADFFHIGTNDLVQFTQAVDRTNRNIANLYNSHHSSILKLISNISRVCKKNNIPLCLCGEMANSPLSILILITLGIRHFSMNVYDTLTMKPFIKSLSYHDLKQLKNQIFKFKDHIELENFFKEKFKKQLG